MANSASAGQLAGVPTAGRAAIAVAVALVVVIGVLAVVAVATGVVPTVWPPGHACDAPDRRTPAPRRDRPARHPGGRPRRRGLSRRYLAGQHARAVDRGERGNRHLPAHGGLVAVDGRPLRGGLQRHRGGSRVRRRRGLPRPPAEPAGACPASDMGEPRRPAVAAEGAGERHLGPAAGWPRRRGPAPLHRAEGRGLVAARDGDRSRVRQGELEPCTPLGAGNRLLERTAHPAPARRDAHRVGA